VAVTTCLFFTSTAILRFAAIVSLNCGWPLAWQLGLGAGLINDASFALYPIVALVALSSLSQVLARFASLILAVILWLATFSNLNYFRFFKSQLQLWMITGYSSQLWSIRRFIIGFFTDVWALSSLAFFFAALWSLLSLARAFSTVPPRSLVRRAQLFGIGVLLCIGALLLHQSQHWFGLPQIANSIASEQIIERWHKELEHHGRVAFRQHDDFSDALPTAPQTLGQFSQLYLNPTESPPAQSPSLVRDFNPPREQTDELRRRLGLPQDRKINVVLLFLESVRSFEFLNDEIGPQIFPNLRRVLQTNGLLFQQAYSSAMVTVAGQYATLCSALNRFDGPPVYESNPFLTIQCLPSLFSHSGYQTAWMNPYHRYFAGKFAFESNHGTQTFFDREYFKAENAEEEENSSEWGITDRPFLKKALVKLGDLHATGKPFFAHLLTTGTHGPWPRPTAGYQLPPALEAKVRANPEHAGYLLRLMALDEALGEFFKDFFASPLAEDTAIFLVSDHGNTIQPTYPSLSDLQRSQLLPRIMFGVVTRNLHHPEIFEYPVHQMDMAPWIATAAGLYGKVSWLGRNPMTGSGSVWLSRHGDRLAYRTPTITCADLIESPGLKCWQIPEGLDPLLTSALPPTAEDPSLTNELLAAIRANEALIAIGQMGDGLQLTQPPHPARPVGPAAGDKHLHAHRTATFD
jgi:hypothetical protein